MGPNQHWIHRQWVVMVGQTSIGMLLPRNYHLLPCGDDPLPIVICEVWNGEGVPREGARKADIGLEASADGFLPGDEHRRRRQREQNSVGIVSVEHKVRCDD